MRLLEIDLQRGEPSVSAKEGSVMFTYILNVLYEQSLCSYLNAMPDEEAER
ncbi:hypothetical protein [Bradyrhizobium lablabi]|uniref:hypothetical protein n=1 Tax=Bradyrhizobium lablabi TaxID=722472 RepID=UPI001BAAF262|nr:hypothetical protein [Bradyrhizobium lablabi]MBR0693467.1 hypothetical protein [Bradyrhizobium lablabi]